MVFNKDCVCDILIYLKKHIVSEIDRFGNTSDDCITKFSNNYNQMSMIDCNNGF